MSEDGDFQSWREDAQSFDNAAIFGDFLERAAGIEPASLAWKAGGSSSKAYICQWLMICFGIFFGTGLLPAR
jgi:hypothetical protein